MRYISLLISICFSLGNVSAQDIPSLTNLNYINTAVTFLQFSPDGRAFGMGESGVATSADAYSINWNTSKLALTTKKTEIGVSVSNWLDGSDKMNYLNFSGYTKLDKRHTLSTSLTYFGIGNNLKPQATFNLREYEFTGGYAFQLADRIGIGINMKGIYSNLPKNVIGISTQEKLREWAIASDISFIYVNDDISLKKWPAQLSFGLNISDLGNKLNYTNGYNPMFLPANLKIGTAYEIDFKNHKRLCIALDFNKLLVPTPPVYSETGAILSGIDPNTGIVKGLIQSFYDAPGIVIQNSAGIETIQKNSRLREELNEITIGGGLEYVTNKWFLARLGYFYEHKSKGERQYFTLGFGLTLKDRVGIDFSYLVPVTDSDLLIPSSRLSINFSL
ncbi:MAG: type IX secretion system outer membrane channel protein PorV [Crocinitomicaceae bacterium]